MKTSVINIGSELLKGLTLNTNLQTIAGILEPLGADIILSLTVGDSEKEIINALSQALKESEVIITTGGLGPTDDDLTREAVIEAFGLEASVSPDLISAQEEYYGHSFEKMALLPKEAEVLPPERGTAPGWKVSIQDKTIFVLPGVPDEMKGMLQKFIVPFFSENISSPKRTEVLRFINIKETVLEQGIKEYGKKLEYGILPKRGMVDIYLVAEEDTPEASEAVLEEQASFLIERFSSNYLGGRNATLEEKIISLLHEADKTVSTAESVTGGRVADKLTDIPGSSKVFTGSLVAYHNDIKTDVLKVKDDTLKKFGAVSDETAREMAEGARKLFKTDYALATTGIAGPGGATAKKPVGLNFVALASEKRIRSAKLLLKGDRLSEKNEIADAALSLLLEEL